MNLKEYIKTAITDIRGLHLQFLLLFLLIG